MKPLCNVPLGKESAGDDFSHSFMYSVHQMHFLVQKHLEHVLIKNNSLTFSQFMVLVGFKCRESGPVSQSTIATQLDLTEATVSRHIATLVKLGLIKREEDEKNRRKHVLTLTAKGSVSFTKAKEIINKELTSLFSTINAKDRDNIMKNFKVVLGGLISKK